MEPGCHPAGKGTCPCRSGKVTGCGQYGWPGRDHETYLYRYRFEDPVVQHALQQALPVARLHRRIGKADLAAFRMLSDDGYVQQTEFSDGTSVVANFANELRDAGTGIGPIQPLTWRAFA